MDQTSDAPSDTLPESAMQKDVPALETDFIFDGLAGYLCTIPGGEEKTPNELIEAISVRMGPVRGHIVTKDGKKVHPDTPLKPGPYTLVKRGRTPQERIEKLISEGTLTIEHQPPRLSFITYKDITFVAKTHNENGKGVLDIFG